MYNMKRIFLLFSVVALATGIASAQPAKRRTTSAAGAGQKTEVQKKGNDRASMQCPTSASMPDDVVWKRDIYRQLDLTKDKNAPLYYPVEPQGKQVNLFTYLFRLFLSKRIPVYTYKLDGIYYIKVWLNEGELSLGDDIMYVLIGGDIRPHVVDALQYLVGRIKSQCVTETERN